MNISIPKNIAVWGLTGGIGSGKSLAAQFFRDSGIEIINLDNLGKEIIETDPLVHQEIKKTFGPSVFLGSVPNRKLLQEIIFNDSVKKKQLEQILHPKIWKLFLEQALKKNKQGAKLILCEAALLIEHQHQSLFPKLIVVIADKEIRKQRVLQRDQMSPNLFDEILKSQVTDKERKQLATDIILNEGTPNDLKRAVEELVQTWKNQKEIY